MLLFEKKGMEKCNSENSRIFNYVDSTAGYLCKDCRGKLDIIGVSVE